MLTSFVYKMGLLQLAVTWYMLEGKLPTGTSKTSLVQFSSVYCFAITECTNANYYYLNTNGEEAQGKPSGL